MFLGLVCLAQFHSLSTFGGHRRIKFSVIAEESGAVSRDILSIFVEFLVDFAVRYQ